MSRNCFHRVSPHTLEWMSSPPPPYLQPYLTAARRYHGGFGSLLWASEATQRIRFNALTRLYAFTDRSVLDAGCGRADLLAWLVQKRQPPHDYIGLEAVDALADAAEARHLPGCTILRADFVSEPARLFVGADAIVFCGSLNTLTPDQFEQTLTRAFDATAGTLLFNFLSSPERAAARHLSWYPIERVLQLARGLTNHVRWIDDYLAGDCTMSLRKEH